MLAKPFPVILDYESQSEVNLKKCGSYVYAEHPSTKVICAFLRFSGYRIYWTMDRYDIRMPQGVIYEVGLPFLRDLFSQPGMIAIAHNVDFERPLSEITLGLPVPEGGWRDTMDQMLLRGLPGGADAAGMYLAGMGKDMAGFKMMIATCQPRRNGEMPVLTDLIMQKYLTYNEQDTIIQQIIVDKFGYDIHPEWENRVNQLHRRVNHRGVAIDVPFARTLREFDDSFKKEARERVEKETNGEIKGSDLTRRDFILEWCRSKGLELSDLRQDNIEKVLEADSNEEIELPVDIYSVLTNRMVVTRAALSKVDTAIRATCRDGRMYALLRYWGAHTGRWSGLRLQLQNLKNPSDDFKDVMQIAIKAIEQRDLKTFTECCKGHPPYELLSSLIRGVIIPRPGCKIINGDFSQIEARVLLWMAEDNENLHEYVLYDQGKGPDIYCRTASFLYRREIVKGKDNEERQIGKIAALACGYQGGQGAVHRFANAGGIDLAKAGIDAQKLVTAWREKHPRVVDLWWRCDDAFRRALRTNGKSFYAGKCEIMGFPGQVQVRLPSGRILTYVNARIEPSQKPGWEDQLAIVYDNAMKGKVIREETSPGKLCQNFDQAIARDLLADAMLRVDETGDEITFSVHDEQNAEVPEDQAEEARASMEEIMKTPPEWGRGIPMNAKPRILNRYGK